MENAEIIMNATGSSFLEGQSARRMYLYNIGTTLIQYIRFAGEFFIYLPFVCLAMPNGLDITKNWLCHKI